MTRALTPDVVNRSVAKSSLEWKLTNRHAFGLTTASPLQRAVCRIADGEPIGHELARDETVITAVGDVAALPTVRPKEMFIVSGIRTAKSLIASCGAFHMAMTCDVSSLRPGEIPRVSVVSLAKDNANVVMNHLVGSVQASPLLRPFLIGDPSTEGLTLRHPSGTPVEICVVAGSRAGSSLVSRWSAGCIFDEFPRMIGGDDGVVNWDDSRQAVLLRLLRGSQLWHIGSPFAPYGPAYEVVTEHFGKPTAQRIVIKAPAWAMNPIYWTPERIAEARKADPDAAKTDVDAEFATPESAMFSLTSITNCTRKIPVIIPPKPGNTYYAAMDPATRGNGWTLCIATREGGKSVIVRAEEWIGSRDAPLDPGIVLAEIAGILGAYGVRTVHSDQVMGDALMRLGRDVGLSLSQWTIPRVQQAKKFLAIRTNMDGGLVDLPPVSHLRTDLLHIRKRATPTGITIDYPMTSDGRHCDFGPAVMLVLTKALPDPTEAAVAIEDPETARVRAEVMARFRRKEDW